MADPALIPSLDQLKDALFAYATSQANRRKANPVPALAHAVNGVLTACDERRAALQKELAALERVTGAVAGVKKHLDVLLKEPSA